MSIGDCSEQRVTFNDSKGRSQFDTALDDGSRSRVKYNLLTMQDTGQQLGP